MPRVLLLSRNELVFGWSIRPIFRSVSLIAKGVLSNHAVRDRRERELPFFVRIGILHDRGPRGCGVCPTRRPLISTVSGPVLDTMGARGVPHPFPRLGILSLSSAGRLRAIRVGKPSTCAILGLETAHKGRLRRFLYRCRFLSDKRQGPVERI